MPSAHSKLYTLLNNIISKISSSFTSISTINTQLGTKPSGYGNNDTVWGKINTIETAQTTGGVTVAQNDPILSMSNNVISSSNYVPVITESEITELTTAVNNIDS